MRLFVAVHPSAEALAELDEAERRLRRLPEADELRWTPRTSRHLTLCFLGEVPEERLPKLRARLAEAVEGHPVLTLHLQAGGAFGRRVLWADVQGTVAEARELARDVSRAARHTGIEVDTRPWRPHLTLARARERFGPHPDLHAMVSALDSLVGTPWTVERVHLMRSLLGRGPAQYESVESWALRRPEEAAE
ncbi:RNA 2',3'-cyclic phosphodiesterase [Allostreptomyces psammosilenae]|uniref:RNA 2',3'-cyclic phosphodiesterase n=1 Tax=Allostreptomyces psammosilenae TaxID=1892865 RepID=A0A852ZZA7_9ACTN|nr:RNA 2',3'-cyclic phosphodiesterase [Allostreptomyces psammosilenae]NYI07713.1 2'-5' RNA ligase [Allostreptomyces psammosilenae]